MRPPRVRPSTWLSYRKNIERHIVPALGHLPLQRPTPAQLTAFYRGLLETGHRKGSRGLAPKTVRNIHGALHAALRDAVRWGYVARNVAAAADLPKSVAPAMQVWSPEQLRAFLDHVRDDRLYAAWLLLATTGMRRVEVAGLRWDDVGLDVGRVSPRRPRVVVNHQVLGFRAEDGQVTCCPAWTSRRPARWPSSSSAHHAAFALHLLHGWWTASCPNCGHELGRSRDQETAERAGQRRRCPICRPERPDRQAQLAFLIEWVAANDGFDREPS